MSLFSNNIAELNRRFFAIAEPRGGSLAPSSKLDLPLDIRRPSPDPGFETILTPASLLHYNRSQLGYLKNLVPDALETLQAVGINAPGEAPLEIIHPCSGEMVANGDWNNLYQHCLLVGDRVARVFTALKERQHVGEADVAEGARQGCLHDRNRRYQRLEENFRTSRIESGQPFQAPSIDDLVNLGIERKLACLIKDRDGQNPEGFDNRSGGENIFKFLRVDQQGQVHSLVLELLSTLKSAPPEQSLRNILNEPLHRELLIHSAVAMVDNFTLSCKPNFNQAQHSGIEHHLLDSLTRIFGSRQFAWYEWAWQEGYYLSSDKAQIKYFRPAEHPVQQLPEGAVWLGNIVGLQVALTQHISELFKFLINPKSTQAAETFMVEFVRAI